VPFGNFAAMNPRNHRFNPRPLDWLEKKTCRAADVLAAVLYNYLYKATSRRVNP
jgi:hypothetical protein